MIVINVRVGVREGSKALSKLVPEIEIMIVGMWYFCSFVARDLFGHYQKKQMLKYTLVILCFFASCQSSKTESAKGVLTKQELTTFLIEMYLAEARLDNIPIGRDSAIKLFIPYEDKLMKKFKIADSTLKKTYQYYLEHPKDMEEIYDVLIDSLSLREQRTNH